MAGVEDVGCVGMKQSSKSGGSVIGSTKNSVDYIFESEVTSGIKIFFLVWTIFKIFIEIITILLLFPISDFFAGRHMGSYLPHQGSNPHP